MLLLNRLVISWVSYILYQKSFVNVAANGGAVVVKPCIELKRNTRETLHNWRLVSDTSRISQWCRPMNRYETSFIRYLDISYRKSLAPGEDQLFSSLVDWELLKCLRLRYTRYIVSIITACNEMPWVSTSSRVRSWSKSGRGRGHLRRSIVIVGGTDRDRPHFINSRPIL